jgi:hypothetical protein
MTGQHWQGGLPPAVVSIPQAVHRCQPPQRRPREEWRQVLMPLAWMKPEDRKRLAGKTMPIPTPYPPGTVWVCVCGRGWIKERPEHYGNSPHRGYVERNWRPVRWWHRRVKKRIDAYEREAAYGRARAIVDSYVLPTGGDT